MQAVPIHVSYFSTPAAVPPVDSLEKNARPEIAMVIDVLRATTTMNAFLANGAIAIHTFAEVEPLQQAASQYDVHTRLLAGERGGVQLPGFDLGNSPIITSKTVAGKRILMSTTNGTRALATVRAVPHVFAACLPNRRAVIEAVLATLEQSAKESSKKNHDPVHVWIVGSGGEGKFSLEDTLCAGALAAHLQDTTYAATADPERSTAQSTDPTVDPQSIFWANDDVVAALAVWQVYQHDPEACLRQASHGQSLAQLFATPEEAQAEFQACAALDVSTIVPYQSSPGILELWQKKEHQESTRS